MDRMYPSKGRGSSQTVQCSPRGSVVRGADGGCWIIIHDTDTVNRFYVRCFFDGSGNLWEEGIYEVDTTVTKRTYTAEELRKVIIGYVGDDEVSVDNKQDSTQRNYGVLKKLR